MNDPAPIDPILEKLARIEQQLRELKARVDHLESAQKAPTPVESHVLEEARRPEPHPEEPQPPPAPPPLPRRLAVKPMASGEPAPAILPPPAPAEAWLETEPASPTLPRESVVKSAMKKLGLQPPAKEENLEVRLGTWWATRVGALLAIICVVFFGIYVSQRAAPWIRFLELLAVSLAVTGAGWWIRRRYEKFGEVLQAVGLALIYFTAFGAYALPTVKIIQNPVHGTLVQFLAVLIIVGFALGQNSSPLATLALVFGYVAGFFALSADLNHLALAANLSLALAGVFFYVRKSWTHPYLLAVPLTYLVYAACPWARWQETRSLPAFEITLAYLLSYLLIFGAADFVVLLRNKLPSEIIRRLIQITNTTAAIAMGYVITATFYSEQLSTFYFVLGIVLLSAAALYYFSWRPDALMQVYLAKGLTLITLGLITEYGGNTRWLALAIQSAILLLAARRSRLRVAEFGMALSWLVSLIYFVVHLYEMNAFQIVQDWWSRDGQLALAYFFLSTLLFCLQARWLVPEDPVRKRAGPIIMLGSVDTVPVSVRNPLNFFYGSALGLLGLLVALAYVETDARPLGLALLAAGVVGLALTARHWLPYVSAAVLMLVGHLICWHLNVPPLSLHTLWLNGLAVIALTIGLAALIYVRTLRRSTVWNAKSLALIDGLLHALWMLTLTLLYNRSFSREMFLFAGALTSVAMAVICLRFSFRRLADCSVLPLVYALAAAWCSNASILHPLHSTSQLELLWAATAVAGLYAAGFARPGILQSRITLLKNRDFYQHLHLALFALLGWYTLYRQWDGSNYMLALAAAGMVLLLLLRWPGMKSALWGGLVFLFLAHFNFQIRLGLEPAHDNWPFLCRSLLVAIFTLTYALAIPRFQPGLSAGRVRFIQWLTGALTMLLLFPLFGDQRGVLRNYITVLWGLSGVSLFLLGLAGKSRPLRMLGLIGLALCIPRVFLVDIRSTLYRIVAFGVLGVVLLLVGFLYHKYRDSIQRLDAQPPPS